MSLTEELPPDLVARLQEEAERAGLTLMEYVTGVLRARAAAPAATPAGSVTQGGAVNVVSDAETLPIHPNAGLKMEADITEPLMVEELAEAQRAFLGSLEGPFYDAEYVE
jgi:hypothetical protein